MGTGAADIIDLVHHYRESHALNAVGIVGWGTGGLIATKALEASLAFGAAVTFCAPIGSIDWQ